MPDLQDLDKHIRELVARAVADAPAPPEIGDSTMIKIEPSPDRRRWWVGGTAVILAAAAAILAIVLIRDDSPSTTPATVPITTPATTLVITSSTSSTPTLTPSVSSPTTSASSPTTSTVAVTAAPSTAPPTTAAATTAVPTTSSGPVPGGPTEGALVIAGPQGIRVVQDFDAGRVLEQPAEMALLTPGDAVIFQAPRPDADGDPGDPQIWRPDGTVEPFLDSLAPGQWYRLHDVATISGIPTVLYGVRTDGPDPANYSEALKALALDPAGWRTSDLGEINTWEGGYSRLSLTDGGTVIGTVGEQVSHGVFWAVVPGSPDIVSPPPVDVGVTYTDCDDCPDNFAISRGGDRIAWTEGDSLVVRDVTTGESTSWEVQALVGQPLRSLDVYVRPDGGVDVLVTFGDPRDDAVAPPVIIETGFEGGVLETPLIGRAATYGE